MQPITYHQGRLIVALQEGDVVDHVDAASGQGLGLEIAQLDDVRRPDPPPNVTHSSGRPVHIITVDENKTRQTRKRKRGGGK